MHSVLQEVKKRNQAVAQFNINNMEWTRVILQAANDLNTPVILGITFSSVEHMCGFRMVEMMVREMIEQYNIAIPVVLHLDHGNEQQCVAAINAGFTSVMIDASQYEIERNIDITKRVVKVAKEKGVSVEAEVGNFNDKNDPLAKVEDCEMLVRNCKVDCLASAVGTLHGMHDNMCIDYKRLKDISDKIRVPISLHGGSGINAENIKQAIAVGVNKINFNTENMVVWSKELRRYLNEHPNEYHPRKIVNSGIDAIYKQVQRRIVELRID